MNWLFVGLFMLALAHAHTSHEGTCNHDHTNFLQQLYTWFSSQESDVTKAPCKASSIPSIEELEAIVSTSEAPKENAIVSGVELRGETPELIAAFRDLTTGRTMLGNRKTREQINMQAVFSVNPDCDKVLCAMEKIWGREAAAKMLYIKMISQFNTSEFAFAGSRKFRTEELDDVILALHDLPSNLRKLGLKGNQRLTPHNQETLPLYGERKVHANSVIMLFPRWAAEPRPVRQYILFHELSHNVSTRLKNIDESPEWLELSGWQTKDDDWRALGRKKCFISDYAKANPWEDFAESFSAYRYNGARFKQQCPVKYQFLKDRVFQQIEYLTEATCTLPPQ